MTTDTIEKIKEKTIKEWCMRYLQEELRWSEKILKHEILEEWYIPELIELVITETIKLKDEEHEKKIKELFDDYKSLKEDILKEVLPQCDSVDEVKTHIEDSFEIFEEDILKQKYGVE